jgi:sigma-B regulation protein RsbU (phosphoserine phosphatase)
MSDVNRQLVLDVEDSGQFVTMFFLTLDTNEKQIEWVRAGHDPAVIYDPGSDSFSELSGQGIALGLNGSWRYEDNQKSGFAKGCIIFLSTDGVWEATNKKGDMLGKAPIYETIRQNAALNAEQIIDAIFDTVHQFIDGLEIQDDITAVVIKLQK